MAVVLVAAAGCGVPGDGTLRAVNPDDVPYRLLESSPPRPQASTGVGDPGAQSVPRTYLVDPEGQLLALPLAVDDGPASELAETVLAALASGPTEAQRARGLSSALGPGAQLRVLEVASGTGRVDIQMTDGGLAADRLPLAIGQVVLTTVSVPGIERVVLEQDGQPLEAPLPGGEQTAAPLVAADYASLLAAQ